MSGDETNRSYELEFRRIVEGVLKDVLDLVELNEVPFTIGEDTGVVDTPPVSPQAGWTKEYTRPNFDVDGEYPDDF